MLNIIQKHYRVIPDAENKEQQLVGYQLIFKHIDLFLDSAPLVLQINELDYFKDCSEKCKIVFKQEPKKQSTQCFENSGYALMKGRNWNFFM